MYRDFYLCLIRENIEDCNFAIEFPSYCINANRNKLPSWIRIHSPGLTDRDAPDLQV